MSTELRVINGAALSEVDREELDSAIESLISAHKNNRQEINRLVFESVAAMTTGEDYERQLANKKGLRRFLGSITGSNKKLQDQINSSRAMAQYAAQQTLQRLAEQNLMTFDLIAAVNNKLNASVAAVEGEINQIYAALVTFFKQSRSDMIQLENRVERLEKNVNLLNWQNSIEYQMFNGVEYADLDDISKAVCLTRDFYDLTKGEWTTSDLLLLKTAMSTIDLSPRRTIDYFDFIKTVTYDNRLSQYLLAGKQITQQPEPYLVPLLGMRKLELLGDEERFVVDTLVESLSESGVAADREELTERTVKKYVRQEADVDPDVQVNCYDLIVELLFNLREAESAGILNTQEYFDAYNDAEESAEVSFQRAAELFKKCELEEAHPLLVKLSNEGYARANALLYWLFLDGYKDFYRDEEMAKQYTKKGYQAGDAICTLQYALFCGVSQEERVSLCRQYKPRVSELAMAGDAFAAYMMGICFLNQTDEEINYFAGIQWFMKAAVLGFYRAYDSIAIRYLNGDGIEKNIDSALFWALQAVKFPCGKAYNRLAEIYEYSINDLEKAVPLYLEAAKLGSIDALNDVSAILLEKKYAEILGVDPDVDEALRYALIGDKHGNAAATYNAGWIYYKFKEDRVEAKKWFEKSAAKGYQRAADFLKQNY